MSTMMLGTWRDLGATRWDPLHRRILRLRDVR